MKMVLLMNNNKLFNDLQVKLAEEIYKKYDKVVDKVAKIHKTSNREKLIRNIR